MSITLNVRTEDPLLEGLLAYLETHSPPPHPEAKIWLLEKAIKWLRASLHVAYDSPREEISINLSVGRGDDIPLSPH